MRGEGGDGESGGGDKGGVGEGDGGDGGRGGRRGDEGGGEWRVKMGEGDMREGFWGREEEGMREEEGEDREGWGRGGVQFVPQILYFTQPSHQTKFLLLVIVVQYSAIDGCSLFLFHYRYLQCSLSVSTTQRMLLMRMI